MDYKCQLIQGGSITKMIRKHNEKEFLAKEQSLYINMNRITFDARPLGKSFLEYAGYLFATILLSFSQICVQTKHISISETLTT